MQNEESLNLLNQKPGNVKNALVQKLSKQWPLTLKQLDHALKREFGMDVTYQAIHKAMQQLEEEKVVIKEKDGYRLNSEWIFHSAKKFGDLLKNYFGNQMVSPDKEVIQMTFTNWLSMGRFIIYQFEDGFPNPENKHSICNWLHVWPALPLSAEELLEVKRIHEKDPHISLCPANTALDKYFAQIMNQLSKKCLTGKKIKLNGDIVVKGDYIAQIFYESKFYEKVDKFYKQTKDPTKIDLEKISDLATMNTKIDVVIIRNQSLSDEIRSQTLSFFKD